VNAYAEGRDLETIQVKYFASTPQLWSPLAFAGVPSDADEEGRIVAHSRI